MFPNWKMENFLKSLFSNWAVNKLRKQCILIVIMENRKFIHIPPRCHSYEWEEMEEGIKKDESFVLKKEIGEW